MNKYAHQLGQELAMTKVALLGRMLGGAALGAGAGAITAKPGERLGGAALGAGIGAGVGGATKLLPSFKPPAMDSTISATKGIPKMKGTQTNMWKDLGSAPKADIPAGGQLDMFDSFKGLGGTTPPTGNLLNTAKNVKGDPSIGELMAKHRAGKLDSPVAASQSAPRMPPPTLQPTAPVQPLPGRGEMSMTELSKMHRQGKLLDDGIVAPGAGVTSPQDLYSLMGG